MANEKVLIGVKLDYKSELDALISDIKSLEDKNLKIPIKLDADISKEIKEITNQIKSMSNTLSSAFNFAPVEKLDAMFKSLSGSIKRVSTASGGLKDGGQYKKLLKQLSEYRSMGGDINKLYGVTSKQNVDKMLGDIKADKNLKSVTANIFDAYEKLASLKPVDLDEIFTGKINLNELSNTAESIRKIVDSIQVANKELADGMREIGVKHSFDLSGLGNIGMTDSQIKSTVDMIERLSVSMERLGKSSESVRLAAGALKKLTGLDFNNINLPDNFISSIERLDKAVPDVTKAEALIALGTALKKLGKVSFDNLANFKLSSDFTTLVSEMGKLSGLTNELQNLAAAAKVFKQTGGNFVTAESFDINHAKWKSDWESKYVNATKEDGSRLYAVSGETEIERTAKGIVRLTTVVQEANGAYKTLIGTVNTAGEVLFTGEKNAKASALTRIATKEEEKALSEAYRDAIKNAEKYALIQAKIAKGITVSKSENDFVADMQEKVKSIAELEKSLGSGVMDNLSPAVYKTREAYFDKIVNVGDSAKFKSISTAFNGQEQAIATVNSRLQELLSNLNKVEGSSDAIKKVEEEYVKLMNRIASGKLTNGYDILKSFGKTYNQFSNVSGFYTGDGSNDDREKELQKYIKTAAGVEDIEFNKVLDPLSGDVTKVTGKFLDKTNGQVRTLTATIEKSTNAIRVAQTSSTKYVSGFQQMIDSLGAKLKSVGRYLMAYVTLQDIWRYFKQGVSTVKEFDTALTEMRKVSDESLESLKKFQKQSFDLADNVGTTALQLQKSTADFMRLGNTLNEATQNAQTANILFNVSEFETIDEATSSLISMEAAYKNLSGTEIIDKLNNIGNHYAVSTEGISQALQRAGSALTTAGNTIDESTAMIAASNTVIQDPEKVGNGLRTIALRLTGTKAAAETLQEMGEETEGMIQTESKLRKTIMDATKTTKNPEGFDILTDSGQYKSTYEILQGIADIWEEIGEMDKATGNTNQNLLLETMAGKNRANILAAILQSPDVLRDAYIDSQNSEGSAQEELDKYLESIEGKMQQFRNAAQELATDLLQSDMIKFFVELGTVGVHALDAIAKHINILTVAAGAFMAIGAKKSGAPLLSLFNGENGGFGIKTIFDHLRDNAVLASDDEDVQNFIKAEENEQKYWDSYSKQKKITEKARKKAEDAALDVEKQTPVKKTTSKVNNRAKALQLDDLGFNKDEADFINMLQHKRELNIKRKRESLKKNKNMNRENRRAALQEYTESIDKKAEQRMSQFQKLHGTDDAKIAKMMDAYKSGQTVKGTSANLEKASKNLKQIEKSGKSIDDVVKSTEKLGGSIESAGTKMKGLTDRYAEWSKQTGKAIPIIDGFQKALEEKPGQYTNDFEGLMSYIKNSGQGLSLIGAQLKSIGKNALDMAGGMVMGMAVAFAVQKAIEGLEYLINYSDHMIENGKEARNSIEEVNESIDNTRSTIQSLGKVKLSVGSKEDTKNVKNLDTSIDQIAKRYTELKRGVDSDNENIFLSEDEYSEFLDISNKLAESIPNLKYGTDSSGNAILALGDNAAESAIKIRELYDQTQKLNSSSIDADFATGMKGYYYELEDLKDKYGISAKDMFGNGEKYLEDLRQQLEDAKKAPSRAYDVLEEASNGGQIMEGIDFTNYIEDMMDIRGTNVDRLEKKVDNAEKANAAYQQKLADIVSYTSGFISSREAFGNLDYDLQDTILKSFSLNKDFFGNLLIDTKNEEGYKQALYDNFVDPLVTISDDIEKQESLKDLINAKVGDITPEQFKSNYQSELKKIFEGTYSEELDKMFGFDAQYNQYQKYRDAIRSEFLKEGTTPLRSEQIKEILGMSNGDLEIAYKVLLDTDEAVESFDQLKEKMNEYKDTMVESTAYLNDYIAAQGKANSVNYQKVSDAVAAESTYMARGIKNEDYSRLIGGFNLTTTPDLYNYTGLTEAMTAYSGAFKNVLKEAMASPDVKDALSKGIDLKNIKVDFDTSTINNYQEALSGILPYLDAMNISQEQFNSFVADGAVSLYSLFETFDTQQRAMKYFTEDGLGVYSFMKDILDTTDAADDLGKAFIEIGKDGKVSFKKNEKSLKALAQKFNISTEAAGYLLDAAKDIGSVDIGTIYAQAGKNTLSGFLADLQAVSAAMSEISQNGYLTYDTMTNLVTANGAYADALVNTGSGMILNTEQMREMNEQAAVLATAEIQDSVEELTDKYLKNTQVLSDFTKTGGNVKDVLARIENANGDLTKAIEGTKYSAQDFQNVWSAYSENQSLESTIIDLQRQQSEIRASVSLMKEYKDALQTPNMNANFLTTVGGKEGADKLYEQGWWGTDDFITYAKLIGTNGMDDKEAILGYQESLERVGKYLTEDASGVFTFFDDAIAKGEELGVTFDEMDGYKLNIDNMEAFAEAMGVTTEFAENMVLALHDAGQMDVDLSMISDGIRNSLSTIGDSPLNDEQTLKNAITLTQKMGDGVESATDKLQIMQALQDQMLNGKLSQEMLDYANENLTNVRLTDEGKIQATTEVVKDAVDGAKNHIEEYRNEADAASKTELFKNVQSDVRALSNLDVPTLNKALNLKLDTKATKDQIVDAIADAVGMSDTEKLSLKLGIEIPEDTTAEVQRQLSDLQDAINHLNELKLDPKVRTEELDGAMDSVLRIANAMDAESRKQFLAHFGIEVDEQGVINVEATKANLGQPVQTTATVYVPQDTLDKLTALQSIVKDVGREHDGEVVIEGSEDAQEEVQALADELAKIPQEKLIEYGFTPGENGKITATDITNQIGTIDLIGNIKALPTVGNSQNVSVNVTGNVKEGAQYVNNLNSALGRLSQRGAISVSVDTSVAQSQIQGLRDVLTALGGTVTQAHVGMEKAGFESGATVVNATLNSIGKKVASPTVSMNYGAFRGGASDVRSQMSGLDGLSAYPSVSLSGGSYVLYQIRNIKNDLDNLDGKTARTYVETVKTTKYSGNGTVALGTVHANASGTANAYAGGTPNGTDVAIKKNETALVNELGYESIVFSCNFIQRCISNNLFNCWKPLRG